MPTWCTSPFDAKNTRSPGRRSARATACPARACASASRGIVIAAHRVDQVRKARTVEPEPRRAAPQIRQPREQLRRADDVGSRRGQHARTRRDHGDVGRAKFDRPTVGKLARAPNRAASRRGVQTGRHAHLDDARHAVGRVDPRSRFHHDRVVAGARRMKRQLRERQPTRISACVERCRLIGDDDVRPCTLAACRPPPAHRAAVDCRRGR